MSQIYFLLFLLAFLVISPSIAKIPEGEDELLEIVGNDNDNFEAYVDSLDEIEHRRKPHPPHGRHPPKHGAHPPHHHRHRHPPKHLAHPPHHHRHPYPPKHSAQPPHHNRHPHPPKHLAHPPHHHGAQPPKYDNDGTFEAYVDSLVEIERRRKSHLPHRGHHAPTHIPHHHRHHPPMHGAHPPHHHGAQPPKHVKPPRASPPPKSLDVEYVK